VVQHVTTCPLHGNYSVGASNSPELHIQGPLGLRRIGRVWLSDLKAAPWQTRPKNRSSAALMKSGKKTKARGQGRRVLPPSRTRVTRPRQILAITNARQPVSNGPSAAPFVLASGGFTKTIQTTHDELGCMCGAGMLCECNMAGEPDISEVTSQVVPSPEETYELDS
jgi:hypothetical protein